MSMITERAVVIRLNKYLLDINLIGHRTGHSTETALFRLKNDIMMSTDQTRQVILLGI